MPAIVSVFLALLALQAVPGQAQSPPRPTRLTPDLPLERELAAGEHHHYRAELTAGEWWRLAVDQRGVDVVVECSDPQGQRLITVDSPLDRYGTESLALRANATGNFRFEVRPTTGNATSGHYVIRLEALSETTPEDRRRRDAEFAVTAAGQTYFEAGSRLDTITSYRQASALWRALGRTDEEATALYAIANLTRRDGKPSQALALYRRAVQIWRSRGATALEAMALNGIGLCHWRLAELAPAHESLQRSLALRRALDDPFGEAETRGNQCLITHSEGNLRAALACYREVLELFQDLGAPEREAVQFNNIGFAYYSLGEPQQAITHYRHALDLRLAQDDRSGEAQSLNNIAVVHRGLGEIQEALGLYGRVREIQTALNDRRQEAAVLHNVGVAYQSLGELSRAAPYLQQALELRRELSDRRGEIVTLNNLGRLERQRGDLEQASALHHQALALARQIANQSYESTAWTNLGSVSLAAGEHRQAIDQFDQAIKLLHAIGDKYRLATALSHRGEALLALGEPTEALASLTPALNAHRAVEDRVGEADTLIRLARAQRILGGAEQGRSYAQEALEIVESLRTSLGSPDLRASFLATRRQVYELMIDLLMDLHASAPDRGHHLRALEISERARARSLLDLLPESGDAVRETLAPALRERRQELLRRLNAKAERRLRLLSRGDAEGAVATQLELERQSVFAELDNVEAEIRHRHPGFAALSRPEPLSADQIRSLLDPDTVLLEYALGEERSFLWVVAADSTAVFELPARHDIERVALRFHRELSTPDPRVRKRERSTAAELSGMILGPASEVLKSRRLAVVADGALHYIPFAALPSPTTGPGPATEPLLVDHEIVHLPSASALALQRNNSGRGSAPRLAAVVADPVFGPNDPRLAGAPSSDVASSLPRDGLSSQYPELGRLPLTRDEALAIAALAPPGEVTTLLDFTANRSMVLSDQLASYRVVHFATHGVVNAELPELSGLALSRVDANGQPLEGALRLRDIYNLRLAADLVVLSGCQTALGKEVRGEGLVGLTRGFMYAGAPRVVASLWWVQDRATAELMTRFYAAMWTESLSPAAALRQAQLALWYERRWQDPFYWAAFVHQGDWR